jgi:hypothetical protein
MKIFEYHRFPKALPLHGRHCIDLINFLGLAETFKVHRVNLVMIIYQHDMYHTELSAREEEPLITGIG